MDVSLEKIQQDIVEYERARNGYDNYDFPSLRSSYNKILDGMRVLESQLTRKQNKTHEFAEQKAA